MNPNHEDAPECHCGDDSTGFPPACGVMDGPGFDDLDLCQAAPPEPPKGMWGRFSPDEIEAASYREIKR